MDASGRPPPTASRRPPTSMRVGTTATKAAGFRVGTASAARQGTAAGARPMTRGAGAPGSVLVANRPMTQQGLGGLNVPKTAGPGRQVHDQSYFMAALRSKMGELATEITKMRTELQKHERDQSVYTTYETRAEALAKELKSLQGELGDLNTMNDRLNTNIDIGEVKQEMEEIKAHNDRDQQEIDSIYAARRKLEEKIKSLEKEIATEKNKAEAVVNAMAPSERLRYNNLNEQNQQMVQTIEAKQRELEQLSSDIAQAQAEVRANPVKVQAVALYEQLKQAEQKRDTLKAEAAQSSGTFEEQRERMLNQVKNDNQDIAAMERRIAELEGKIKTAQEEMQQLDDGDEDVDDEKRAKYDELVKRDAEIQQFLDTFDDSKASEQQRIETAQSNIVALLERVSAAISRTSGPLPSQMEHEDMQSDLAFKSKELEKSQSTAESLQKKRQNLKRDLENFDTLESKISKELANLKAKIDRMEKELVKYNDLDSLTRETEATKRRLATEKQLLLMRRDAMKQYMQELAAKYEKLKNELNENETYTQLSNLEKKLQHNEKNNFVMREFIASKEMEADTTFIKAQALTLISDYNQTLIKRH